MIQEIFVALIHGVSLLALMAIAFGAVERLPCPRAMRSMLHGLIFGAGAVIAMMAPAQIGNGVMVDARALIVGFAAAFGGWPAAVVAVAISSGYRLWLGGIGAIPGASGIAVAAVLGLAWRYFLRPRTRLKGRHLMVLGLVVSGYLLTSLAMGYSSMAATLGMVAPYMVATSVAASLMLGLFVDRELNQIAREQHWKTHALTDPLTALPNRRAFERGMSGLRLQDSQAALLILDLDHFKAVNDTYGHAAGDHVLQRVSMVLQDHKSDRDLLSRLGGEEMAVLLTDTDAATAGQVAERIRHAIETMDIIWQGHPIPITVSIGIALAPGTVPNKDMLERADAALYAAKHSGRNCVVFAGVGMLDAATEPMKATLPGKANSRAA